MDIAQDWEREYYKDHIYELERIKLMEQEYFDSIVKPAKITYNENEIKRNTTPFFSNSKKVSQSRHDFLDVFDE